MCFSSPLCNTSTVTSWLPRKNKQTPVNDDIVPRSTKSGVSRGCHQRVSLSCLPLASSFFLAALLNIVCLQREANHRRMGERTACWMCEHACEGREPVLPISNLSFLSSLHSSVSPPPQPMCIPDGKESVNWTVSPHFVSRHATSWQQV